MNIKNKILQIVRTPLFKQRVVKDKTKYDRKVKNKKAEKQWN
jgi:stalled ribosome alternative rescue factor ArfA|tara:strand:- start:2142 stop:2267 length:126 start_codon:yes stop_codon:yes gene_type:complete